MPRINRDKQSETTRPSTLVNRRILPGVLEREELNRLLRAHDPEVAAANSAEITAAHAPLLRQIALEPPTAAGDPGVRGNAITWLGRLAAPADLNVLTRLAQFDADPGVRGAALLSLGASGVQLAAPVLAAALVSRDTVEAVAAAKGLRLLAKRVGTDPVMASISPMRGAAVSELAKKALVAGEPSEKGRKRQATRADPRSASGRSRRRKPGR
jgi:HEAT repeat protein